MCPPKGGTRHAAEDLDRTRQKCTTRCAKEGSGERENSAKRYFLQRAAPAHHSAERAREVLFAHRERVQRRLGVAERRGKADWGRPRSPDAVRCGPARWP